MRDSGNFGDTLPNRRLQNHLFGKCHNNPPARLQIHILRPKLLPLAGFGDVKFAPPRGGQPGFGEEVADHGLRFAGAVIVLHFPCRLFVAH